jgi:hypothetical protein
MEAATLWERLAVTLTRESTDRAKPRQISAVPNCALARRTSAHVRPAPLTPVTLTPADLASVAMKARSNSLLEEVLKEGVAMVLADVAARDTMTAKQRLAALVNQLPGAIDRPTAWQSHYIAKAYAVLGQYDPAIALLGRTQPRGATLWWVLHDPDFDRLRDRSGFSDLLTASSPTSSP